jgi:hypothetical protein
MHYVTNANGCQKRLELAQARFQIRRGLNSSLCFRGVVGSTEGLYQDSRKSTDDVWKGVKQGVTPRDISIDAHPVRVLRHHLSTRGLRRWTRKRKRYSIQEYGVCVTVDLDSLIFPIMLVFTSLHSKTVDLGDRFKILTWMPVTIQTLSTVSGIVAAWRYYQSLTTEGFWDVSWLHECLIHAFSFTQQWPERLRTKNEAQQGRTMEIDHISPSIVQGTKVYGFFLR